MSAEAGVVRDGPGLGRLIGLIDDLQAAHGASPDLTAARLTAACALTRAESLGAHFRVDAPQAPAEPRRTFVTLSALPPSPTSIAAE